mgnify:CR=1 FL=1
MDYDHSRFGKCKIADITQGQAEKFATAMQNTDALPQIVWNRRALIAASEAGIIAEPKLDAEQINAASPGYIRWLANCIAASLAEASSIDPLP